MDSDPRPTAQAAESGYESSTLELPAEAMRSLGYAAIDAIIDHVVGLRDRSPARPADRAAMEARLREPPPEQGMDPAAVLARVLDGVLDVGLLADHPRFFAYVPVPGNFVGAMADALVAGFNVHAGVWAASPGAAQVELVVVDWLRQWCGLPDGAGGLFLSGTSIANLVGLVVARHARFEGDADAARRGTVYCSDQTHASVGRALRILGIGQDRIRRLPSDANFRLAPDVLARAVNEDRLAGLVPFCVVANVGTVDTGAVDPLPALADYCAAEGLWLHADGAFGAAAVLCDAGRPVLQGLKRVDSLALDAHKWLAQPIECGCLLVRDAHLLRSAFHDRPAYLRDTDPTGGEVNFAELGPQLTRAFRALKLWMSVQVFGLGAFRAAVARGIALAEMAEQLLRADPRWDVATPAQLGVVTFRHAPDERRADEGDALIAAIARAVIADGLAVVGTTQVRGRTVLRLCTTNPRTTEDDVVETVRRLGEHRDTFLRAGT